MTNKDFIHTLTKKTTNVKEINPYTIQPKQIHKKQARTSKNLKKPEKQAKHENTQKTSKTRKSLKKPEKQAFFNNFFFAPCKNHSF